MSCRCAAAPGARGSIISALPHLGLVGKRIFVAGHNGMVGRALIRRLAAVDCEILTAPRATIDLRDQEPTFRWLAAERPDVVIVAAAKVGGILANARYPADFLYDNLAIEMNVLEGAKRADTERLLFLGSSCIYPKLADQPITEESLLTGPLEPTNEWYAIAKIAGIKLCQAYRQQHGLSFISAMPTNLFGPYDNWNLETSHVLPALIVKTHQAKVEGRDEMVLWGTGTPRREFLHVDDVADASIFLLEHYDGAEHVNIGTGEDLTINELARMVADTVGWQGRFVHDTGKPDGTPRKLLDVSRLKNLGWSPRIPFAEGLVSTYRWYLDMLEGRHGDRRA
jgi:GDP-L-fucose synthase